MNPQDGWRLHNATTYSTESQGERLTWTKTNMAPLRGWGGPGGIRLPAKVPHGRWRTTTFLASLRHDRIGAPWVLDGPIDGESFRIYQTLSNELRIGCDLAFEEDLAGLQVAIAKLAEARARIERSRKDRGRKRAGSERGAR